MSNTPHELAEEFPEHVGLMHQLRTADAHFANLSEAYHTANRAVHRAETDVAPTSDEHMAALRKARMHLEDTIYAYLKSQQAS
ncbi:DUF465 domain-containing protein [Yoonia sp. SS1-5]|uniref:YdcH family protein n=1 Tax=Yoonia rhodophyticola TaxID=3137370 RepID=A0AAN0MB49_9RHOB